MTQHNHPQTSQLSPRASSRGAIGPLVVSKANPRYFTVVAETTEGKAVYLTGSHIWNNFHDGMGPGADCADAPEQFDYATYLQFLKERGHNFIRLWRWEQFKSQAAGGSYHLCMSPQPWARTGQGMARDGKPKYDLTQFDQAYFDRLRDRVMAAGKEGIYVAVMLFDGFALHLSPGPDNVEGHPFHAGNNINGIGIASILDYQVLPLDPRIQALQEAYIRKAIDTVQDLPNVLYEVANESSGGGPAPQDMTEYLGLSASPEWGDSTRWQYWVINVVKEYEQQQGYNKHPIGMTMQYPVADSMRVNEPLFNSPADWISPGWDDAIYTNGHHPMEPGAPLSHWVVDPPVNDGRKVIISDTDHYAPPDGSDVLWAWKSFLRGHHPILMDFGIIAGVNPSDPSASSPGVPPYALFEPTRLAMGDTRRYAERMRLVDMVPHGDLTSTGYALANPGVEYLVLQPSETADTFTVTLAAGTYTVEWFNITTREMKGGDKVTVEKDDCVGSISFKPPFTTAGPVVLYLSTRSHADDDS